MKAQLCFQIRGLVSRSNTSGFYSLPPSCQSEESDLVHPTQLDARSVFKVWFLLFSAPVAPVFWHLTKAARIIHC